MRIYTRSGDEGQTSFGQGKRLPKSAPRIEAIGSVDELSSWLGRSLAQSTVGSFTAVQQRLGQQLPEIQSDLFLIGAELGDDQPSPTTQLPAAAVGRLEQWIDQLEALVPPLHHFILPGGSLVAADLHIARTVCRRAERCVVRLAEQETVRSELVAYLNRLSDYLFTLARWVNQELGVKDVCWLSPQKREPTSAS